MSDIMELSVVKNYPFKNMLYWLNDNIEKYIIVSSYFCMSLIIFVEIFRRYFFQIQSAWSTSIPVLLFLWLTWIGASINVKKRTHLSLTEVRLRLPYSLQFACLVMDAVLWLGFASIVIYHATDQVMLAHDNFAIVQGTDNVMMWWFYLATPIGWSLIIFRVLQNLYEDFYRYKNNEPLIFQTSLSEK